MRPIWLVAGTALLVAAGCGGDVLVVGGGGSGGSATTSPTTSVTSSTTSSDGGTGGYVPGCSVPTELAPPYPVTIRLNSTDGVVFVREDCVVELSVRSCLDDYAQPLAIDNWCSVDCVTDPDDCMLCEPCLPAALAVGQESVVDVSWGGLSYTFGTNAMGCRCSMPHTASAAHYRVSVPVYATEQAALDGAPGWTAETDFTLPDDDGVVYVSLTGI